MTGEVIFPVRVRFCYQDYSWFSVEQKKENKPKTSSEHCMKKKGSALPVWSVKRKEVFLLIIVRLY